MAFLDKLGDIAKNAKEKTGDMLDITRLNGKVSDKNKEIAALKVKLGDYTWGKFNTGDTLDATASGLCEEIKAAMAEIESLQQEIQRIKTEDSTKA